MSDKEIDLDIDINKKIESLDEEIENLILDTINIADINFESGQEFNAVKKYLKDKLRQAVIHVTARMQRARLFDDREINE